MAGMPGGLIGKSLGSPGGRSFSASDEAATVDALAEAERIAWYCFLISCTLPCLDFSASTRSFLLLALSSISFLAGMVLVRLLSWAREGTFARSAAAGPPASNA